MTAPAPAPPGQLLVVVLGGEAGDLPGARELGAFGFPAEIEVRALPADPVSRPGGGPSGTGNGSDRSRATRQLAAAEMSTALHALLGETRPDAVALARPGERLEPVRLARAFEGLRDAPEAVLATPALLWRPPAAGLDVSTRDWRQPNPNVHEGRRLARLLALRALSLPWPGEVLLRRVAIGDDLPAPFAPPAQGADAAAALFGSLLVSLLLRGFAWSGGNLGWARREEGAEAFDLSAYGAALTAAARTGVAGVDDVEQALVNLGREAAWLSRREVGRSDRPVPWRDSGEPSPGAIADVAARARAAATSEAAAPGGAVTARPPAAPSLPAPRLVGREGPLRRFLIAAPDYETGSAGPVALHMLCDRLNRQGYEATIALIDRAPGVPALGVTNPSWITPIARLGQQFEHAVAVYPENLVGNPLGSPFVVRWLLHRPGYFTGIGMAEDDDDLVVAWHESIAPGLPVLGLPLVDLATYSPGPAERRGRLLWVGKGAVPPDLDRSGMTELTRSWPASRTGLAAQLQQAEMLVTCDWLTSLTDEALLCGTPVVFAGDQAWAPGAPMLAEHHLAPGVVRRRDGRPDAEQLRDARAGCAEFRRAYLQRVEHLGEEIDGFVHLVNAHFDGVAKRQLAGAASGAGR